MNLLLAAAADNPNVLEGISKTFGLNVPFFAAQVVNFILVIWVLKKFAFGPIGQILSERRERILAAEEKVKLIEKQLAESEITTAAAIAKANEDASRLINEAKESSAAFSAQKTQEAIASAQQILAKAETAAQAERAAIKAELKAEFGRLVAATTSQVTGKVLNDDDQRRINDEALAKVEG
ncbi:ATP synthase F0 subunit B [Luteolibacter sp. SL250]|uniref:ATP synthase F0 subunit B n=1 Tax=Luteolibacter sp. SL250 TaxID=2995170 RepID=UPI00226F8C39|nr:ATP synthase F0 subunit B [Luteolibacter sp. SL250]WAC20270.1 ATP synthase F0 subunit B [Luteolibacter sp. SL250]